MTALVPPAPPFVNFKMKSTKNIGSTPTLIFGSSYTCVIVGIIIANQTQNALLYSLYLLREEGTPTPSEAVEYPFILDMRLEGQKSMDWVEEKT